MIRLNKQLSAMSHGLLKVKYMLNTHIHLILDLAEPPCTAICSYLFAIQCHFLSAGSYPYEDVPEWI